MKRSEYILFQSAVFEFMRVEGLTGLEAGERTDEFSGGKCEVCGSALGGERFQIYGMKPAADNGIDVEVYGGCADCCYYAAYGKLDDMTMADMLEDETSVRLVRV